MPFVPSDLSANAQPPENAVNEQTDRWTDRQTNNNIHKHPWMLSVSHLDTSACQIVGHFFQALCMQYTNPSPWMVGRTDERMKWQQYPSASMLAKGKSSGNICISNSMPFHPSDLSANVQKPENVVNRPIDGQTDGQTDGQKGGRGALLLGGIAMAPSTWFRNENSKMSKKSHHFLTLWPWPLTYDLEKLIRSGHYHYQCVHQIWEQSIPWFLSYRVNTIAGGGRLRRKTITSSDPSDTGHIITMNTYRPQWAKWTDTWGLF